MHSRLRETLKESGYSVTAPRRMVFEVLLDGPVSYTQVAIKLQGATDRATTYRTLDLYERLGIVNRIWRGTKSRVELSEIFMPHHHHAVCDSCGNSTDVTSHRLEQLLSELAKEQEFLMVHHSVELSGYCKACVK